MGKRLLCLELLLRLQLLLLLVLLCLQLLLLLLMLRLLLLLLMLLLLLHSLGDRDCLCLRLQMLRSCLRELTFLIIPQIRDHAFRGPEGIQMNINVVCRY